MDKEQHIAFLLDRYLANQITKEELNTLFFLINDSGYHHPLQSKLRDIWEDTSKKDLPTPAEWDQLYAAMMTKVDVLEKTPARRLIFRRLAVAAAIFISLSFSVLLYRNYLSTKSFQYNQNATSTAAPEIVAGGNKAVLTLANGTKIVLDGNASGVIADQSGVQVSKLANGQLVYQLKELKTDNGQNIYNKIETPKGGQYQINMPDGTRVWLNAMSSLTYPVVFNGAERKVELVGEAYFEVASNKKKPFIVQSGQQKVEVLGTHFNVNAYLDEDAIQTTLLEGSVKVHSLRSGQQEKLSPGQQSAFAANAITVNHVDVDLVVAWKNGNFIFDKHHLDEIMRQLSRWYDVEVVYEQDLLKDIVLSGSVSRFENINQVLDIIELTQLVHFKVEGRRIIVMK